MIKARILILQILFLGFYCGLKAQKGKEFSHIDRIALQISDSLTFSTQRIADYINSNFSTQDEKSRAIFSWIAENIQYDSDNIYAFSIEQIPASSIYKILKTRKGICHDYAMLYTDIANKVGIKTYVITGYTKQNRRISCDPHSWCASLIDSTWYLNDPTWGSGYIQDSHFEKEINNNYFNAKPENFIKTHIPFDPLWQLLNYPITKQEFNTKKSRTENLKIFFNFADSIKAYEKQSKIERQISSSLRIRKNGIVNYLAYEKLNDLEFNIETHYTRVTQEIYDSAFTTYNNGIYLYNNYIDYKNNQYLPYRSDDELRQMLDDVENTFNQSLSYLNKIDSSTSRMKDIVMQLKRTLNTEIIELNAQKDNLDMYL
ncbi:MAG: transglutaminase domain-containing protein, partial [Bacteroidota bacterium]